MIFRMLQTIISSGVLLVNGTNQRFLGIGSVIVIEADILLCVMGRGEIAVVGDINKIRNQ